MRVGGYNLMRDDAELLARYAKPPSSFTIHLYPEHWSLNNGPKFLYNNQVSSLLEDMRAFKIPPDFIELFQAAKVPYYEGCLIVELADFRPLKAKDPILEKPDVQRVVLRPSAETIWADICNLNQRSGSRFTDRDALELESKVIMATAPPLCLEPNPHLTRVVNSVVRVSTPNTPNSLKRKAVAADPEEDETDKAKRAKIMQYMNPQANKTTPFHPSYRILALKEKDPVQANGYPPPNIPRPPSATVSTPRPPTAPTPTPLVTNVTQNGGPPKNGTVLTPVSAVPPQSAISSTSNHISSPATHSTMQLPNGYQQHTNPTDPSRRMSPAKQKQPLPASSPQVAQAPQLPIQHPGPSNTPQPQAQPSQPPSFQPPIPPATFLHQPPVGKKKQPAQQKPNTPAMQSQPLPQHPNNVQPQQSAMPSTSQQQQQQTQLANIHGYIQMQQMANAHRQMQAQAQAQAAQAHQAQTQAQNGRNTPSAMQNTAAMARSPMISNQQAGGRGSPMIQNQQAPRQSPLVANQSLAPRGSLPQNVQVNQQPQAQPRQQLNMPHQGGPNPNFTVPHSQFNMHQRPPMIPPHIQQFAQQHAARAQPTPPPGQQLQHVQQPQQPGHPQQPQQDQPQAAQMVNTMQFAPQIFSYAQMGMNLAVPAGMPQQYAAWQRIGMGRGAPQAMNMNGQQHMPGVPPHLQQMQGMGRAMQGGVQGR